MNSPYLDDLIRPFCCSPGTFGTAASEIGIVFGSVHQDVAEPIVLRIRMITLVHHIRENLATFPSQSLREILHNRIGSSLRIRNSLKDTLFLAVSWTQLLFKNTHGRLRQISTRSIRFWGCAPSESVGISLEVHRKKTTPFGPCFFKFTFSEAIGHVTKKRRDKLA